MKTDKGSNFAEIVLNYVNNNSFKHKDRLIMGVKEVNELYDKFKPGTIKPTSLIKYILEKAGYKEKHERIGKQVNRYFVKKY